MALEVKICGLKDAASVDAAVGGGARLTGFVFFPPSPRYLTPEAAAPLVARVPKGVTSVGLVVDLDDAAIEAILAKAALDMLQLHGQETPERVTAVRKRFGLPVMKAVALSAAEDIAKARTYEAVADRLLFDAKPPKGATRPGGNALAFDWELLRGTTWKLPWLLAGGLDAGNLKEAVSVSGAPGVDVSSGVETSPGVKSLAKIEEFLATARTL
jgi:phosphoribosylanthranilate isomerase